MKTKIEACVKSDEWSPAWIITGKEVWKAYPDKEELGAAVAEYGEDWCNLYAYVVFASDKALRRPDDVRLIRPIAKTNLKLFRRAVDEGFKADPSSGYDRPLATYRVEEYRNRGDLVWEKQVEAQYPDEALRKVAPGPFEDGWDYEDLGNDDGEMDDPEDPGHYYIVSLL